MRDALLSRKSEHLKHSSIGVLFSCEATRATMQGREANAISPPLAVALESQQAMAFGGV
jgi:hypothetical protein